MNFNDKNVLIIGAGISGIAAVRLLEEAGAFCTLFDGNENLDRNRVRENFPKNSNLQIHAGELPQEVLAKADLLVMSPGVPTDIAIVEQAKEMGIPVWGEIELAFAFEKGRVLAITGTNGKTTTTALLGEIMKDYFAHVFVVGNIGIPYTEVVKESTEDSVTVAELSSFQLETVHTFKPVVSAILNITPDHLNRHHTMDNYVAAKERITINQTKNETCVLNYEDDYTRGFGNRTTANVIYFSARRTLENGFFLEEDTIYKATNGNYTRLMGIHEMKLLGIHNAENAMAAIAMADAFGVPMESILHTVRNFNAVEHRIEFVATKDGVDYYNDSKGTNPDAAIKGIQAMNKPTCLIGGGYDKQNEYDEWINSFDGKVKLLVLIGQTREKIAECAKKNGFTSYVFADSLEEAVKICCEHAVSGDAVLLSPACASWGMFPNYEVRGNMFKEMVHAL